MCVCVCVCVRVCVCVYVLFVKFTLYSVERLRFKLMIGHGQPTKSTSGLLSAQSSNGGVSQHKVSTLVNLFKLLKIKTDLI